MIKQVNILTENCGKIRPDSVDDYIGAGGFEGLKKVLSMQPLESIEEIKKSKLVGRGGAAYPTGLKWEQAYNVNRFPKFIVCNADEGEPGTFKDKLILNNDPLKIIEGIIIAGYILNASMGYIYIRGEYPISQKIVNSAIKNASSSGYLGKNILGTDFNFTIEVLSGAGAYVVGENSALVESCEGKAGRPRIKPPYIKNAGLNNQPTLVNNVETFSNIPYIIKNGGDSYSQIGTEFSSGTKLICLSGNIIRPGVYEVPFGITLKEIIYDIAGGIPNNKRIKFIQTGGSSGTVFNDDMIDTPLCYKVMKNKGITLGSGAILVADESNCIVDFIKCITEFFIHESCGKCTPCREGNRQLYKIICRFENGTASVDDYEKVMNLCNVMKLGSFCGLGQTASTAFNNAISYFKDEFDEHINGICRTSVCTLKREVH